jgi:hypothetical protein
LLEKATWFIKNNAEITSDFQRVGKISLAQIKMYSQLVLNLYLENEKQKRNKQIVRPDWN